MWAIVCKNVDSCLKISQICLLVCWCKTNPLLSSKFPISHQMNLIGKVHGHSQLDQEINTESIATLRYNWASCNKTSKGCKLQSFLREHVRFNVLNPKAAHVDWTKCVTQCPLRSRTQTSHSADHACPSIPTITHSGWHTQLHAYIYRYLLHIYVCISSGCLAGAVKAHWYYKRPWCVTWDGLIGPSADNLFN